MKRWTIYGIDPLDLGRTTLFCFVFLPLLFTLLVLWLDRRFRFPPKVSEAYQKARAQGR